MAVDVRYRAHPLGATGKSKTPDSLSDFLNDPDRPGGSLKKGNRSAAGSPLLSQGALEIPNFAWSDAPSRPSVPPGDLVNTVSRDYTGTNRLGTSVIGALLP
jgi:hypothetical protein